MPKLNTKTTTTINKSLTVRLSFLLDNPLALRSYNVPKDANVVALIPGGGDYSNCEIHACDLDIQYTWTVTKTYEKLG